MASPPGALHVRLSHVNCAFGGTGVSASGDIAVVVSFDVMSSVALGSMQVIDLAIYDAPGASVARALPPIELRVSLPGRDEHHNLRTEPFGGAVAAGASVRLCAGAALTRLVDANRPTLRYRASIDVVLADGERRAPLVLEGPLDQPWPTAGPARPA